MFNNKRVIVSLTSWPKRIDNVSHVISSLINQTIKPDSIELNLSLEEFPDKENNLPKDLQKLVNENKLILNWVEKNTLSFKKFIPVLKKYFGEEYYLITIDDDKLYKSEYIQECLNELADNDSFSSSKVNIVIGGRMTYRSKIFDKDFIDNLSPEIISTGIDDSYIMYYLKSKNAKMKQKFLDLCESFNEIEPLSNYYKQNNRIDAAEFLSRSLWFGSKNGPIDMVVTFLDSENKKWQTDFNKYRSQIGLKTDNRFRDWGTMRYVLRGFESNCPWINKIHIILYDESMVPDWLDINNPKIHIVYHKDYIPEKYLPTFSSQVIEMFMHKIPGLAENFIYSCDDMLFLRPIKENMFFINNRPVSPLRYVVDSYLPPFDEWCEIENNNYRLEQKIFGKLFRCDHPHFQIPFHKSFMSFIWSKLNKEFEESLSYSKFRNKHENQLWIFDDIQRLSGYAITCINIFKNSKYISNINDGDFSFLPDNLDILCFNDIDTQTNFETVKNRFIKFMESKLPNKSSYENN